MPALDIQTLILAWVALCGTGLTVATVLGVARFRGPRAGFRARRPSAPESVPSRPTPAALQLPDPADLRQGLRRTRTALMGRMERLLRGRPLDPETLDEIEEILFQADLGVRTAEDLLESVRGARSAEQVRGVLEQRALEILREAPSAPAREPGRPHVVLVVGVNGSGKTTSIGKLAARYTAQGQRVLVAAADTFRAAAIEQLEVWAERAGAELVKGSPGGDPAAVAFDAIRAARAREIDVVLIDTAGRLHTHAGLMDELVKVSRVIGKEIPGAPHEVLLVLDANTGQNAIRQAEEFSRALEVTHILLAKLDGTAKGGVVLGIAHEVGVPVRYLGVGEQLQDLLDFDPELFVQALFVADEVRGPAAPRAAEDHLAASAP